jgi:hypothetical protein
MKSRSSRHAASPTPQFKCVEALSLSGNVCLGAVGVRSIAAVRRDGGRTHRPPAAWQPPTCPLAQRFPGRMPGCACARVLGAAGLPNCPADRPTNRQANRTANHPLQVLNEDGVLSRLDLSGCEVGSEGAAALGTMLKGNK